MLPMTGVLTNKRNWSEQAPTINSAWQACRNFGFGNLPNSGRSCAIKQFLVAWILACNMQERCCSTWYLTHTYHYHDLTIRIWETPWRVTSEMTNWAHVRIVLYIQLISVLLSPLHPLSGQYTIYSETHIYRLARDLRDTCERLASNLRGTCEQCLLLFTVASTCAPLASHLRVTCE